MKRNPTGKQAAKSVLVPTKPAPALAAQIKKQHGLVLRAFREGLDHARKAGELLLKAKEQCAHGDWTPWIETNCGFNVRTAQQYMQIAEGWDEIRAKAKHVSHLPMRDALKLLAKPKEAEPEPGPSADSSTTDNAADGSDNAKSHEKATDGDSPPVADVNRPKGPRRVFDKPPYSSETHFKVQIKVTAHLEGFHHDDNPELTAEEIQEKLAEGEMFVEEASLGLAMRIKKKHKGKRKATNERFGDVRDTVFKVVSVEPIEGVPEDWKEAMEFFRLWKTRQ